MKIGFIGCGNMAQALIQGILAGGEVTAADITASDPSGTIRETVTKKLGITFKKSPKVASGSDYLFLAVKPQVLEQAIGEIRGYVGEDTVVVSIAPGKSISWLRERLGSDVRKIVRIMPNTPALVSEGMMGLCPSEGVSEEEAEFVISLCEGAGKVDRVPEKLMDTVTAVSGSAPAYVFMMIEAMADAAVADGMPRDQAYRFASQAVLGSAKMVLETRQHPAHLKDMVCSPGGTTAQAVRVLEERGFRSALIEAVLACAEKSREL